MKNFLNAKISEVYPVIRNNSRIIITSFKMDDFDYGNELITMLSDDESFEDVAEAIRLYLTANTSFVYCDMSFEKFTDGETKTIKAKKRYFLQQDRSEMLSANNIFRDQYFQQFRYAS
jgi:hypothetical protein